MLQRLCVLFLFTCVSAQAAWFEATGQAIIHNDNKEQARQQATQEAIKQALLFAGARVESVQTMTNGLLKNDTFSVHMQGEVNSLELIDEQYQGDVVTVSIRADIFPQKQQCLAADYRKNIATTWYPIQRRQQATVGALFDLGKVLPEKLQQQFQQSSPGARVNHIEQGYVATDSAMLGNKAISLAQHNHSQFVLFADIADLSVQTVDNGLALWRDSTPTRQFDLHIKLFDGSSGDLLLQQNFTTQADWPFDLHQEVNPFSQQLWQSGFGQQLSMTLNNIAMQISETLSCLPAYGRILRVANQQISINMGKEQGVMLGDELTIFQMRQQFDPLGNSIYQYQIHPVKVKVTQLYHNTAVLEPVMPGPLHNIQANDYVVRR